MKRAAVLIASHQRVEITSKTIQLLQQQTVLPKIVLVVSDQEEFNYFVQRFPSIHIVKYENQPLGRKWQVGVDYCRRLDISALIIQGSDDILCKHFVYATEQSLARGIDFVGLQQWYITDPNTATLYQFDYTTKDFPLGGGRYYSRALLDKLDWQIFDTTRKSCLDDKGWFAAKSSKHQLLTKTHNTGFEILAVKGDWQVMNSLAATLNHPNARIVKTYEGAAAKQILMEKFNYG